MCANPSFGSLSMTTLYENLKFLLPSSMFAPFVSATIMGNPEVKLATLELSSMKVRLLTLLGGLPGS